MKKTFNKSILKSGYYYEALPWYDKCSETLPKVEFKTEIFSRYITHKEILKEYNITPYGSYNDAAKIVVSLIDSLKSSEWRIVYFKEDDVLYRFSAFRGGDSQLDFHVDKVDPDNKWDSGYGVCFGYPSDTQNQTLSPSESLTLATAVEICKEAGYIIYKPI